MKKTMISIMLIMSLMFSGCSFLQSDQAQQITTVALGAPELISDIEVVIADLTVLHTEEKIFTEGDMYRLEKSMGTFNLAKQEYDTLMALHVVPDIQRLKIIWSQSKIAYLDATEVLNSHRGKYNVSTMMNIDLMILHAEEADRNVQALLAHPTTSNISQVLRLIGGVINIGTQFGVIPKLNEIDL